MRLRKIDRKVYLGIYDLLLMETADTAFEVLTSGWNHLDKPLKAIYGSCFFGLKHVKIALDGEAYVELGDFYPSTGFYNLGVDFFKNLFQTAKSFYEGFEYTAQPLNPRINELPYSSTQTSVRHFSAIVNVWNDTFSADDVKLLGLPFDPFKQVEFKPYWEIYQRLVNRSFTVATKKMSDNDFNELKATYEKIPEFFGITDNVFSYINLSPDEDYEDY